MTNSKEAIVYNRKMTFCMSSVYSWISLSLNLYCLA